MYKATDVINESLRQLDRCLIMKPRCSGKANKWFKHLLDSYKYVRVEEPLIAPMIKISIDEFKGEYMCISDQHKAYQKPAEIGFNEKQLLQISNIVRAVMQEELAKPSNRTVGFKEGFDVGFDIGYDKGSD